MNRTSIPTLIGVFISLLVIWALHTYIVIDDCLDNAGSFQYDTGKCLLENGEIFESMLGDMAIVLYFFVGFIVSLVVSSLIRKFFNIKP